MRKIVLLYVFFSFLLSSYSQNASINNTGAIANTNAMLDIDVSTNNKGILIPRITTAQRTAIAGLGAADEGLLVFDETLNGFWYWDGSRWVQMLNDYNGWKTTGNAGTAAATNFIGTTDAIDMIIRTNNAERMRITSAGMVGINTNMPGTQLDVNGAITHRETVVAVTANTANIPSNVSQVILTGTPTGMVAVNAPAAPNPGQRLVIHNNTNTTSGWFGAKLNNQIVPCKQALEFVYSNGQWIATSNPAYSDGSMLTNGLYLDAGGGTNLVWNNDAGWVNNTITPIVLGEVSDPNGVYNPVTGEITITEQGIYHITTEQVLQNNPGAGSTFNGAAGTFDSYLQVLPAGSGTWIELVRTGTCVLRGNSVTGGTYYRLATTATLLLKPGDKIRLAFLTYGTGNMNGVAANLIYSKTMSWLRLYRG